MNIVDKNVDEIIPYENNPRKNDKAVPAVAKSIQEFGFKVPIVIDKNNIIVNGHTRLKAAKKLGLETVPCIVADDLTPDQIRAFRLADYKVGEIATWDDDKLEEELTELTGIIDMQDFGFEDFFSKDAQETVQPGDDDVKEPAAVFVKPGDLWVLGRHKLLCGDATKDTDVDRIMAGEKAQLVHTDPPYGVSYVTQSGKYDMIKNDDKTGDDLLSTLLVPAFKEYVRNTDPDAAFYIWHASSTRRDFEDAMLAAGLLEKQYIIWAKPAPVLGHADYQWSHEPCFYSEKAGQHAHFYGDRTQRTVWMATIHSRAAMAASLAGGVVLTDGKGSKIYVSAKTPKGKKLRYVRVSDEGQTVDLQPDSTVSTVWEIGRDSKTIHPTQKPLEIPIRAINNSSKPGDLVLDFFGGSGSTLIAAEKTGRRCNTIELDPKYCSAIIDRYIETVNDNSQVFRINPDGTRTPYMDVK
ncbi:MAG: DNA modification methylase [Acidaminococcus fermentans]|nr:DNA modification methylase [Acidaminococcus fermentans]MDY2852834.1 DNA modification methylase [Acidaminococcus fermentans]